MNNLSYGQNLQIDQLVEDVFSRRWRRPLIFIESFLHTVNKYPNSQKLDSAQVLTCDINGDNLKIHKVESKLPNTEKNVIIICYTINMANAPCKEWYIREISTPSILTIKHNLDHDSFKEFITDLTKKSSLFLDNLAQGASEP